MVHRIPNLKTLELDTKKKTSSSKSKTYGRNTNRTQSSSIIDLTTNVNDGTTTNSAMIMKVHEENQIYLTKPIFHWPVEADEKAESI